MGKGKEKRNLKRKSEKLWKKERVGRVGKEQGERMGKEKGTRRKEQEKRDKETENGERE